METLKNQTGNFYKNARLQLYQLAIFNLEGENNVKIIQRTLSFLITFDL